MSVAIDNFTKKLHDNLEAIEDRRNRLKPKLSGSDITRQLFSLSCRFCIH